MGQWGLSGYPETGLAKESVNCFGSMKIIDKKTWPRREYFDFFSQMASPYFGIVSEVDCTGAYLHAKKAGHSFFASYLHKSMVAVNNTPELCTRILGEDIVVFTPIHAGTTIGRDDGSFGFAYMNFSENFEIFNAELQAEIQAVKNSKGLRLNNDDLKLDLIRHSSLPWINFTGLLHPTPLKPQESVPKITFGKRIMRNERYFLPVSVEAHHGLADGLHVSHYLQNFEALLNPESGF
jgi:chloramphenicol O-acetyltransferase type A